MANSDTYSLSELAKPLQTWAFRLCPPEGGRYSGYRDKNIINTFFIKPGNKGLISKKIMIKKTPLE